MTLPYDSKNDTVLIVDDTPENIALITSLLIGIYRLKVATNGEKALEIATSADQPDLILLDIMMPVMDGYEACIKLKSDPRTNDIPIIFLTSKALVEDERKGLELGAVDYITKPISPPILLARVKTHLQMKRVRDFLKDKNTFLEQEVARRMKEILNIQDVAMMAIVSLAATRDKKTGKHIRRTQQYMKLLAMQLKEHPRFKDYLNDETISLLYKASPLHDIGKVGIPDCILLKPGALTPEEFEIMKTHPALGRDAIASAEELLEMPADFLKFIREMAYTHQEKWDGTGYPEGISGDDIPISGRLMAVADVYDALISRRVYKLPISHEEAVAIIKAGAGTHFDPDVVAAFIEVAVEFHNIALTYMDNEDDLKRERLVAR